jgi:hypothetical protein
MFMVYQALSHAAACAVHMIKNATIGEPAGKRWVDPPKFSTDGNSG